MEGSLAVIGFWLFVIALVMKKPLMTFIEKSKDAGATNSQVLQRLQQLESLSQSMARDLSEIRALIQAQTTEGALLQLKEEVNSERSLQDQHAGEQNQVDQIPRDQIQRDQVPRDQIAMNPQIQNESASKHDDDRVDKPNDKHGGDRIDKRGDGLGDKRDDDRNDGRHASSESILGTIEDKGTIRFERILPAQIEHVWKYLTNADLISNWLGKASLQPRLGGRIELNFEESKQVGKVARVRGLIKSFDAPHSLAYSWISTHSDQPSNISFELSEQERDTKLVLVHSGLPEDKVAEFLAAWHARLDVLIALLRNVLPPDFTATFRKVLPIYAAVAVSVTFASAAPAAISDDSYHTIRIERSHLLTKYDNHWREADELEKEIVRLKHENTVSADQMIDQLDKKLKNEYRDLRQIELDIRELDKALL